VSFISHNEIMKKHITFLVFFSLLLVACLPSSSQSSSTSTGSITPSVSSISVESSSINPVVFSENNLYGLNERQVYEVSYLRQRPNPTPAILFIHGGSWIGGDKSMMRRYKDDLVNAGYVYVSMNYRLISGGSTYLDMLQDIGDVISNLKSNATRFNLDLTQMAIVGESAGAHLGLLYSYRELSAIPIDFIMALVPPLDFTDPGYLAMGEPALQLILANALMGTTVSSPEVIASEGYPPSWFDASPISHLASAVPTLLAYAGIDELIPLSNNERFIAEANRIEAPLETIFFANSGHNLANDEIALLLLMGKFNQYLSTFLS
jgi:acetyl esterase/lipase